MAADSPPPAAREPILRTPRSGWIVVASIAALLGVANLIGALLLLAASKWIEAAIGLLTVVALHWFAAGAWLRTPWANRAERVPPPDPPSLSEDRARTYGVLAALCVLACAIALALQAIVGDW